MAEAREEHMLAIRRERAVVGLAQREPFAASRVQVEHEELRDAANGSR